MFIGDEEAALWMSGLMPDQRFMLWMRMASSVALVLAMPFPAMSKAVPCSGVVMA